MSHTPAVPPSPARRRWRRSRRPLAAYAAGVGAVAATGLAVQACADGRLTGTAAAPPRAEAPAALPAATPGTLETVRGVAPRALDVAWVGAMHNRGLAAVVARAAAAPDAERATAAARCQLVGRLTTEWLEVERGRDAHLRALGPLALSDRDLADLAEYAACAAPTASMMRLRDAPAAAAAAARADGRLSLGGVGDVSPAAAALLDEIDSIIYYANGPAVVSSSLLPVERAAQQLPDESERTLVLEAAITARASAYYHYGQACTDPTGCAGVIRPPDDVRAPLGASLGGARRTDTRAGINTEVVKADVWGCVYGGFRAFMVGGGPPGVFAGCLWGGIGGSGGVIFRHIT